MAGVNIGNQGLTHINYIGGVVETLNHASKARNMTKKSEKWEGEYLEGRVHVSRSGAIKAGEDGSSFPVPGKQSYTPFKATRKFCYAKIEITDGAMATAGSSKNAARSVVESEVKGMMRDILKWENFFFFRDGTGKLATFVDAGSNPTDVLVTDGRGLWDGVEYEVRDVTPTTLHGYATVSNVEQALSSGSAVVNFSAALPAAGDYTSTTGGDGTDSDALYWKDSYTRCITGLDKLIGDSGTFQTINTATYPRYTSHVMSNSGTLRDLTPSLFRQMLAGISQKSGNEKPAQGLKVLTNSWQAINVEELYEGELRLTPDSKVGGLAVSSFQSSLGRVDIMVDTDAPYNTMFFVDFDKIYRGVQKELHWRRGAGDKIFVPSTVAGVHEATALCIQDLYIKERHTCGKLQDLNESATIAF